MTRSMGALALHYMAMDGWASQETILVSLMRASAPIKCHFIYCGLALAYGPTNDKKDNTNDSEM
jgi:hypothetical protein